MISVNQLVLVCSISLSLAATSSAMYDPVLGRFCSRDHVGYEDGTSLYQYVRSSPAALVDPDGTQYRTVREMQERCRVIRDGHASTPDPPEIDEEGKSACEDRFNQILVNYPQLNEIWERLKEDCGVGLNCQNCNFMAQAGNKQLTICWNRFQNCGSTDWEEDWNIVHHELIHLEQGCAGRNQGGGCMGSLKREIEAYFCANNCGSNESDASSIANACTWRALSSSCAVACKPDDLTPGRDGIPYLLKQWFRDWYNQHGGDRSRMCSNRGGL